MELVIDQYDLLFHRLLPQFFTATLCGFIVGYGREVRHKPAGIRTIILISIGKQIFTLVIQAIWAILMD